LSRAETERRQGGGGTSNRTYNSTTDHIPTIQPEPTLTPHLLPILQTTSTSPNSHTLAAHTPSHAHITSIMSWQGNHLPPSHHDQRRVANNHGSQHTLTRGTALSIALPLSEDRNTDTPSSLASLAPATSTRPPSSAAPATASGPRAKTSPSRPPRSRPSSTHTTTRATSSRSRAPASTLPATATFASRPTTGVSTARR
jgi:hypothetical protein